VKAWSRGRWRDPRLAVAVAYRRAARAARSSTRTIGAGARAGLSTGSAARPAWSASARSTRRLTVTLAEQSGMRAVDLDRVSPESSALAGSPARPFGLQPCRSLRVRPSRHLAGRAEPRRPRSEVVQRPTSCWRTPADAIERAIRSLVNAAPLAGADTTIDLEPGSRSRHPGTSIQWSCRHRQTRCAQITPAGDRHRGCLHAADVGVSAMHLVEGRRTSGCGQVAGECAIRRCSRQLPATSVRRALRAVGLDVDAAVPQSGWLLPPSRASGREYKDHADGPGRTVVCAVARW
jgi:hypothetical protein